MNRKLPRLILILLIVALAVALLACSPAGDNPADDNSSNNDTSGGNNPPISSVTINKAQIFGEIKDGLVNAGEFIDEKTSGIRYVDSSYTLVTTLGASSVNIGIEYQANYDLGRAQDSEIMVRVFDYVNEANTMFVYYVDNDLYLQIGDKYILMEAFGGTSTFQLFYEAVTSLDMEHTLFSVDFADSIEAMAGSVESQNISKIILSDSEYNVTVKEINLDPLKTTVNNFITNNVGAFGEEDANGVNKGDKLDAITQKFMGFKLSDLGRVQIGRFNAEMLTVLETQANGESNITDFNITFAGNQANNIDTYYFDVNYATSYERGKIRLTQFDNPENNNYVSKSVSSMHFVGDLYVPYFDQTFDAEIKGNFSTNDNSKNELFIDIVNRTENQGGAYSIEERIFGAMYKDGVVYLDGKGLFDNYLGDFMSYDKLGLPRVKINGLNMSEELQILLERAMNLLQFDFEIGGLFAPSVDENTSLKDNEEFNAYISKIRSEDGVFYITIDKELVTQIIGESDATIISVLANSLGLEEGLIKDIIELGYFDDLALEIAWDTLTDDVAITAKVGEQEIFVLTLRSVNVAEEGLDIAFPDREEIGYFDTFEEFDNPETINVHLEGTLRTQGKESNDISKLMGLFIGDISGNNTNYVLKVSDTLYLTMDLWQKGDAFYVNAKVLLNGNPFVDICSNIDSPEEILINNYVLGVKYKMPRSAIVSQINQLTENKAVWDFDTIVNALEILAQDAKIALGEHLDGDKDGICDKCGKTLPASDFISLIISPIYDEKTGAKKKDPLKDILGVEDFIAELKVNIDFEQPGDLANASEYVTPVVNLIEEERWTSRYEARWVDKASISFGTKAIDFILTFDPESVNFEEGVYEYYPKAQLFGQNITYRMFITDIVNGTKKVRDLYETVDDSTGYQMIIDPSIENPIPSTIGVVYEDNTRGALPYEFVDFPYNNDNIANLMGGLKKAQYKVVIGKGSITEQEFTIDITVEGRNFKVDSGDYYNNIPIVARVSIDPYQYSIEKSEADARGEKYYPFKYREENDGSGLSPETLVLAFYEYTGSPNVKYEYLPEFDWGFDESKINYSGGEFTVVQKYNTLDMAIVIVVQAKKVKHVQINSENAGYYTIDSLVTSTYVIPAITKYNGDKLENEVRIYFETDHYRIIGNEPANYVKTDPMCDGYYNKALDWSIKVADNVTIDRSVHPLDNGRTKYTDCYFGDDLVGKQSVTLEVVCPTRVIGTRALTTFAITSIQYLADGVTINNEATTREAVKVSLASFDKNESVENDYFDFDPYSESSNEKTLPNIVYVNVMYQGRMQTIGYPVTWIAENNVINEQSEIINAFAEETFMRVRGIIGDGELTQTLEMIVHNHSVNYSNVRFIDAEDNDIQVVIRRYNDEGKEIVPGVANQVEHSRRYFVEGTDGKGLNPFIEYILPTSVILQFPTESGMDDRRFDVTWYLKDANGDPVLDANGDRVNAQGYFVGTKGGTLSVYADVKSVSDNVGVLEQTIELNLVYANVKVNENRIYGLASIDSYEMVEFETIYYMIIDTYDDIAQKLYDDLTINGGINKIDIGFDDGSRTRGNSIDISWINLDEFLAVLQSPLGSSTYYNMGKYDDDIIFLRGLIDEGTRDENGDIVYKEIKMGFMVMPRVLGDINFGNFNKNLTAKDENNVSAVTLVTEIERVRGETQEIDGVTVPVLGENGHQIIKVTGKNTISITFNKFFALTNADGLCTPSEYIEYLFKNVSLSFADTVRVNDLDYELPENFDDLIYGNTTTTNPNVTITSTHVIFRFDIEKLTTGSCVQTFNVTLTFLKDNTLVGENEAYNEAVEIFEENGELIYDNNEGYNIGTEFTIEYVNSGKVKYTDLKWYADETATSLISGETIHQGAEVKNIKSDFFNFTSTRIIKLYTTLPNGQKFKRHISFYGKNVNFSKYHTDNVGLYQIVNGTLEIVNVYDYLPLDTLIENLPTAIIPDQTAAYISSYDIKFGLMGEWKPSVNFAMDNDETQFDIEKIKAHITSSGLNSTLFATNSIEGYNGEVQEIRLYVSVRQLRAGQISHNKYNISANYLVYDQYALDGDGTFTLPKDIKVTFGDVIYQFSESDDIVYELRHADDNDKYTTLTTVTYNNIGHTLSAEYGYEANDALYFRVTLPDGNNTLRLIVEFPNRVLEKVYYSSKTSEGQSVLIEGIYYIDPYDRETFNVPSTASFKYNGSDEYVEQQIKWTLYNKEVAPFTMDGDGNYVYNGGEYGGAYYLFHASLASFDDVDKEQHYIMQVFVLNRTLTRPQEYPEEFKAENPFAMRVQDLPTTLSAEDFYDLSVYTGMTTTQSTALGALRKSLDDEETKPNIVFNSEVQGTLTQEGVTIYYPAFVSNYAPVVPNVLWKIEKNNEKVNLVDDDILVNGGFKYTIYGCVGNGNGLERTVGEEIEMEFYADTWVFNKVEDLVNNVVEFNDFTLISILSEFKVSFIVTEENKEPTTKYVTFYPEYYANSVEKEKTVIIWNKQNWADSAEQGSITFTNKFKTEAVNSITTNNVYKFDAQQVGIDELNFGFGDGYAYSGDVEIVIDPLNPIIPTTALARGRLNLDNQTLINLGEVNVDWEIDDATNPESIYYLNMAGATKVVYCNVSSGGENDTIFKFAVRVSYLNRAPETISTLESGYTNVAKVGNYYPLMSTVIKDNKKVNNYTFVVDPTPSDARLFNVSGNTNVIYPLSTGGYENSNYTLPSKLRLTFANDYDVDSIENEGLQKLGAEITLTDIEWVISRDISLVGTSVKGGNIVAKIRKFRVQYVSEGNTYTSELYNFIDNDAHLGNYLTLNLQTINRQVEYTYVVKNGQNEILSEVPDGSLENYQQARDEFYIDPYNIYFPEEVYVIFSGSTIPYHASQIEWIYDEDHLKKHGVITGNIGAQYMLIMAEMTVYGTTLQVQFPIRARNIPVSKELEDGQTTMDPLSAGTLYVLAGIPVEEQLPTKLYYRFDYEDGTSEIASVPLTFPPKSLSTIKTDVVGRVYSHIEAKLGLVDDDNVFFTVKVIDPKLYALRSTVQNSAIGSAVPAQAYVNGGYVYDFIAIGVNAAGAYVPGPETNILPDRIIVSEDGEYMEIMNIDYDLENMIATIECRYTFLSFSDSPKLSGDKDATGENSDKMFLNFKVPIKSYAYNWIEEKVATFENTVYRFPLGTVVTASDMPLTTSGIAPIWELDGLNHNRAGEYKATCHYKNAYGDIIKGEITIIIERREIKATDFTWVNDADGINFRDRVYDGRTLEVKDYIQLGEFLREDGSYGPLNYTVQYSIDGRQNWQTEQPVQVKEFEDSPDYFVRIIVTDEDDYNYTGSVAFKMVINKCIINEEDIYFYNEIDALGNHVKIEESDYEYVDKNGANVTIPMKQVTYEYNGEERVPAIGGVPRGATTKAKYAVYDPNASQQAYSDAMPLGVGTYIMRAYFTEDQRNYTIGNVEFLILIHITKKQVVYSINPTFEYTGEYFDVPVNGLPENLGDIKVTYSYKNVTTNETLPAGSMIKDAGTYEVTVMIDGGRNYPSANLGDGSVYTSLYQQQVTINKRKVILNVNTISSEYLDELKPLDSAITLVSATNPNEPGLIGRYDTDLTTVFGKLSVAWTGGTLTYKHMVGNYPLAVVNKDNMLSKGGDEEKNAGFHKNYEFVAINDGTYQIVAERENTRIISNQEELTQAIQQLREGDTVIWYFMAGNYGTITINLNASVSIIGSYDLSSEEEIIAVSFQQVIVNKGAVLLDIVSFRDIANDSAVKVGKEASSLTVSRSRFARATANVLTNSTAIGTAAGYANTLYISDTSFMGYTTAIYMLGGSLELRNSELYENMNGVYLQKGNIVLDTNKFVANRGAAVNIAYASATTSIFDNIFDSNDIGIKTSVALRNDIRVQNTFKQNTITFEGWSEAQTSLFGAILC